MVFDWNNLRCSIISGGFYEGEQVVVSINDKVYRRRVYNGKDDLYIVVKGYRFYFSDFY